MLDRTIEFKARLYGVEALRTMKELYPYEFLARLTGLSPQILSRYVTGQFLPSLERAEMFINIFKNYTLKDAILKNIIVRGGVIDNVKLLSNTKLLSQISRLIAADNLEAEITKVLTKEADGIPLATLVARELSADLIIAKHKKELGVDDFLEVKQVYPSGTYSYIYVPKPLISKRDRILIVDDILRSGSTIEALLNLCGEAKAEVVGVSVILGLKRGLEMLKKKYRVRVDCIVELDIH